MSRSNVSKNNLNTPSQICLEWAALETKIGTGVNSTNQVAEWNIGAQFHTMDGFFNISLDPNAGGVAGTAVDPDEGEVIDVYLVGYSASAATGVPNTNGQLNGQHFQITRTNGQLAISFVERRIEAGHVPADALTDSFNSISTAQLLTGDGGVDVNAFLTGAGFNAIVSSFSDTALLQLDGSYLVESDGSALTVDDAFDAGWVPCDPEEVCEGWDFSNIVETRQMSRFGADQILLRSDNAGGTALNAGGGNTVTSDALHFLLPDGNELPVRATWRHIGGATARVTIGANGGLFQALDGNGQLTLEILPTDIFGNQFDDVQFGLLGGSVGGGELIQFVAANPVTEFYQGPGGQNISGALPYSGNWNNNNNNQASGFAFGVGVAFVVNLFGQNGVTSSKSPVLLTVPAYIKESLCSVASKVNKGPFKTDKIPSAPDQLAAQADASIPASSVGEWSVYVDLSDNTLKVKI